jgi:hypothetical protein
MDEITPQTWLAQAFKDLVAEIRGLGLTQSTKIAEHVALLDPSAKEEFIAHFEAFWFTVKTVGRIIDDLFHSAVRLESLKKINDKPNANFAVGNDVAVYTASLYDGLYRLIEILAKLQWVNKEDVKKRFRQVHFVWLLRNNFLV